MKALKSNIAKIASSKASSHISFEDSKKDHEAASGELSPVLALFGML